MASTELPDFIEYDNKRVAKSEINKLLEDLQKALETGTKTLFEHEQKVSVLSFQRATAQGHGQQYETALSLLTETQQLHEQNYELVQKYILPYSLLMSIHHLKKSPSNLKILYQLKKNLNQLFNTYSKWNAGNHIGKRRPSFLSNVFGWNFCLF
jgi:hypothetical protein